jgi:hypothetical protein
MNKTPHRRNRLSQTESAGIMTRNVSESFLLKASKHNNREVEKSSKFKAVNVNAAYAIHAQRRAQKPTRVDRLIPTSS